MNMTRTADTNTDNDGHASYYEHDEFADHVENAENGQK